MKLELSLNFPPDGPQPHSFLFPQYSLRRPPQVFLQRKHGWDVRSASFSSCRPFFTVCALQQFVSSLSFYLFFPPCPMFSLFRFVVRHLAFSLPFRSSQILPVFFSFASPSLPSQIARTGHTGKQRDKPKKTEGSRKSLESKANTIPDPGGEERERERDGRFGNHRTIARDKNKNKIKKERNQGRKITLQMSLHWRIRRVSLALEKCLRRKKRVESPPPLFNTKQTK